MVLVFVLVFFFWSRRVRPTCNFVRAPVVAQQRREGLPRLVVLPVADPLARRAWVDGRAAARRQLLLAQVVVVARSN